MRLRTQLILAAFVLAVVPLAAIVMYSHHSSRRALEAAYRDEAERLTNRMDQRLETVAAELDRRLTFVSALALPDDAAPGDVANIVTAMGGAAAFVDALEFKPAHGAHAPPPPPLVTETPAAAANPEVPEPTVPEPPRPPEPVVIELPPQPVVPSFAISEEQRELIGEIASLGRQLGQPSMSQEERQDLREELRKAQEELRRVVSIDSAEYRRQVREAHEALREQRAEAARKRRASQPRPVDAPPSPVPQPPPPAAAAAAPQASARVREATPADAAKTAEAAKKTTLILGRNFEAPVRRDGDIVGQITARVSAEEVVRRVLGTTAEDRSEIPFAIDREGTLYTRTAEDRARLERLGIPQRIREGRSTRDIAGWIVSTSTDPKSRLRFGVARPVGENLSELARATGRNFALGLGLIALALIGIVPLSNHLTRDVESVTRGAERIAQGDLMTRLPVKTKNELGQLARAFNRMAEDLSVHQQKLLEQERLRKEQELQQRLMSVEYDRKSFELEEARRFQLSMLPKEVPRHRDYEVAVFTRTAAEVGGDYYDFHVAGDALSVTIGDATGHGAKAGTMVTVVKTLFAGYAGTTAPSDFLGRAAETIKRMDLGRMAMALSLGRFEGRSLTVASAGMPPVLLHHARDGAVDEISLGATPLGTLGTDYDQTTVTLERGDTILFLTDGLPELMNEAGQQFGYAATLDAFAQAARAADCDGVIAAMAGTARRWHGDTPPNDDVTFVVVRVA